MSEPGFSGFEDYRDELSFTDLLFTHYTTRTSRNQKGPERDVDFPYLGL
jgi:hypothetical protein